MWKRGDWVSFLCESCPSSSSGVIGSSCSGRVILRDFFFGIDGYSWPNAQTGCQQCRVIIIQLPTALISRVGEVSPDISTGVIEFRLLLS